MEVAAVLLRHVLHNDSLPKERRARRSTGAGGLVNTSFARSAGGPLGKCGQHVPCTFYQSSHSLYFLPELMRGRPVKTLPSTRFPDSREGVQLSVNTSACNNWDKPLLLSHCIRHHETVNTCYDQYVNCKLPDHGPNKKCLSLLSLVWILSSSGRMSVYRNMCIAKLRVN